MLIILNSLGESVERPGIVVSRSAGRCRLLNFTEKLVEAAGRRGVVRNALSSPEWGGPREENRTEEDGNK